MSDGIVMLLLTVVFVSLWCLKVWMASKQKNKDDLFDESYRKVKEDIANTDPLMDTIRYNKYISYKKSLEKGIERRKQLRLLKGMR